MQDWKEKKGKKFNFYWSTKATIKKKWKMEKNWSQDKYHLTQSHPFIKILHNHQTKPSFPIDHDVYNLARSSANVFLMTSLLSLRAAVTKPDSGVHTSESNLIFAGISNFSKRAFLDSWKKKMKQRQNLSEKKFELHFSMTKHVFLFGVEGLG